MNVFIFCAVLDFSSFILAFKMSFHTVDLEVFKYEDEPVLVCTKHKFIYHRDDEFTLYIKLMHNSLDVTNASAIVKTSGGAYFSKDFWFEGSTFNFIQKSNDIKIDVELVVNNTCVRQRVLEGIEASTRTTLQKETNITAFKYNDICLKGNQCMVLVDPTRECKDQKLSLPCLHPPYVHEEAVPPADDQRSKTVNKTKKNPETSRAHDDSKKDQTHSPLPREYQQHEHEETVSGDDQRSKTANKTKKNTEASRANDDSKKGAENTYFIVMIVTSIISAVALTLLLVFAIKRRSWINNPPSVPQTLPTNPNPFYENVHIRTEGQKEIEELEQRVYDQVPAENEYEEIRHRSSTK